MPASSVVLGMWIGMPWPSLAALGLLAVEIVSVVRLHRISPWEWTAAWCATLVLPANLLVAESKSYILNPWVVPLAWLMCAALSIAGTSLSEHDVGARWRKLTMTWALLGALLLLGSSYAENWAVLFYLGLAVSMVLLLACKRLFEMSWLGVQAVNTAILFLGALPLVDLSIRPLYRRQTQYLPERRLYAYEAAKKDPGGFEAYLAYARQQWKQTKHGLFMPDPEGVLPWRLRPNTDWLFHQSLIHINSLGFRGPEISRDKGAAYRIVALGESTTFGVTLYPSDQPWPQQLEELIRHRLKPSRPVEVINAGVPALTLEHNLHRLVEEILPLQPDLIVSYHGYNGFSLIDDAFPLASAKTPPEYEQRPIKLLADVEFRARVAVFNRRWTAQLVRHPPKFSDPMECRYANAYEALVRVAETNRVRLALANYSMAVNDRSDDALIEFYRPRFPAVRWQIEANEVHSSIVKNMVRRHPSVCFVDTLPFLDGRHEYFIDLMHFSHQGEQLMAETVFSGLRAMLDQDLGGGQAR